MTNYVFGQYTKLVWSDEFSYSGLPDSTKWNYDVGGHGWGNEESQYYTEKRLKNARVENDLLIIEVHKENFENKNYTSTRLISKNKGDWKYGRVEVKAKLPIGKGTWPAIWMLPTVWNYGNGNWPDNGEIDIMEHVGYNPGTVHGSTHCHTYYWKNGNQYTDSIFIEKAQYEFHVYSLEWTEEKIEVSVDDSVYFTSYNEGTGWKEWPFDKEYHLLLNIAIGGFWGGVMGIDDTIFPQKMEIDYVRVYQ